jgi:hypothetical protein
MKRLNNLYEQFQSITSIEEYFQIAEYKFRVERIDESTFQFNATLIPVINLELPSDVIGHIKSYLINELLIEIKYPKDYPFKCPHFAIVSGENKGIHILNYAYDRDWSPATTFEKDILNLIQHII